MHSVKRERLIEASIILLVKGRPRSGTIWIGSHMQIPFHLLCRLANVLVLLDGARARTVCTALLMDWSPMVDHPGEELRAEARKRRRVG